jgi:hypothetical protein
LATTTAAQRHSCSRALSVADESSTRQLASYGAENEPAAAAVTKPLAMCGVSVWHLQRTLDAIQMRPKGTVAMPCADRQTTKAFKHRSEPPRCSIGKALIGKVTT